jgi:GTP-sensing pleiotropic transcriptional regulator CodY
MILVVPLRNLLADLDQAGSSRFEAREEVLILFQKNPGLIDCADGLARRIGRTAHEIQADLEDLLSAGVLSTRSVGSYRLIFLDRTKVADAQDRSGSPKGLK